MSRFLCVGVRPRILPVLCACSFLSAPALVRSDPEGLDVLAEWLHQFVCILTFIALYTYVAPCNTFVCSMGAYGCIVLLVYTVTEKWHILVMA